MKKKGLLLICILLCMMMATACGSADEKELTTGNYTLGGFQEDVIGEDPTLVIVAEDKTFSFMYDVDASEWPSGAYEIDGDKAICTTDDGKNTYIFEIVDEETLTFVKDESSEVKIKSKGNLVDLDDEAQFILNTRKVK